MESVILTQQLCWITRNLYYTTMSEAIWTAMADDWRLNRKWSQYHSTHISKPKGMKNLDSIQQSFICKLFHFICLSQNSEYYFHGTKMPETLHKHADITGILASTRCHFCRLNFSLVVILKITELWILLDKTAAIRDPFPCHHAIYNKMYCFQISYILY